MAIYGPLPLPVRKQFRFHLIKGLIVKKYIILLAALFIPTLAFGDIISTPNYWKKSGTAINSGSFSVGIGSTLPSAKLDVAGTGNVYPLVSVRELSNTGSREASIELVARNNGSNDSIGSIYAKGNSGANPTARIEFACGTSSCGQGLMKFYTAATEKMRIDNGGNVGIGSTNTTNRLVVEGTDTTLASGLGTVNIRANNTGTVNKGGSINFGDLGASRAMIKGEYKGGSSDGKFVVGVTNTAGVMTERLAIEGTNGNVGISSTNPTEQLDVNGTVKAIGFKFSDGSNAAPLKYISTTTMSAVTNSGDISIDSTKRYLVYIDISSVAATGIDVRFNNDTGSTYDYANFGYTYAGAAINANSATGTSIRMSPTIPNPFVELNISSQLSSTAPVMAYGQATGGTIGSVNFGGEWDNNATVTSFRIITNGGGNMTGVIHLYQYINP